MITSIPRDCKYRPLTIKTCRGDTQTRNGTSRGGQPSCEGNASVHRARRGGRAPAIPADGRSTADLCLRGADANQDRIALRAHEMHRARASSPVIAIGCRPASATCRLQKRHLQENMRTAHLHPEKNDRHAHGVPRLPYPDIDNDSGFRKRACPLPATADWDSRRRPTRRMPAAINRVSARRTSANVRARFQRHIQVPSRAAAPARARAPPRHAASTVASNHVRGWSRYRPFWVTTAPTRDRQV